MSIEYDKMLVESIQDRLNHLTWRCTGCPQVSVCEDQAERGEPRYCWPIIVAAIMGKEEWETDHDLEDIHTKYPVIGKSHERLIDDIQ